MTLQRRKAASDEHSTRIESRIARRREGNRSVSGGAERDAPRWLPYVLLALANLFWAGNWVIGRALRESFAPVTLSFLRWLVAALVLAPFAVSALRGKGEAVRRPRERRRMAAPSRSEKRRRRNS